jgi:hypothetical protein
MRKLILAGFVSLFALTAAHAQPKWLDIGEHAYVDTNSQKFDKKGVYHLNVNVDGQIMKFEVDCPNTRFRIAGYKVPDADADIGHDGNWAADAPTKISPDGWINWNDMNLDKAAVVQHVLLHSCDNL